ncbi:hypothetical protein [Actinopolyspora mortivallis]|uniref:DUF4878 domain-containing protein n=1 Tax=Actinopolyspora mortivallis TaxID=33906 RepID=A0A2T0H1T7_ACTMO|nr:hypothetical protein [Actinopolyspora mortivallis]PRW65300.1 hypothetical protein CEP50_01945 [Actinopolyspora mortivallis]
MSHPPPSPVPWDPFRQTGSATSPGPRGPAGGVGTPSPWGRFPGENPTPRPQESPPEDRDTCWQNPALGPHRRFDHEHLPPELDPPPRRPRRRGLYAASATLLAAALLGGYFLVPTGPVDPGNTAARLVDKINSGRFAALDEELCAANAARLRRQIEQLSAGRFQLSLGEVTAHDATATVELTGTYFLGGTSQRVDQTLGLRLENGEWKLCDLAR